MADFYLVPQGTVYASYFALSNVNNYHGMCLYSNHTMFILKISARIVI